MRKWIVVELAPRVEETSVTFDRVVEGLLVDPSSEALLGVEPL